GHSIADEEMKYGLAVSGFVHPQKIIRNVGALSGDLLFLTKPIGTGTITTALKAGKGSQKMEDKVCAIMARLNRDAAQVCMRVGVNACTDISGFGLLGHAWEMASGSGVSMRLEYSRVPIIEEAVETAQKGFIPGGSKSNQLFIGTDAVFADHLGKVEQFILFDAQTSGGLLVAVDEKKSQQFAREMQNEGIDAPIIGQVIEGPAGKIFVK
ncbi:MAG: selenide, water dikinase SelD, partial [Calditrichaeota bacterium]|nr:selenide, water dikinase SelD [Calditrichota bacterium]